MYSFLNCYRGEDINQRTDNTMVNNQETGQTMVYKTLLRKSTDRTTRTPLKPAGELVCSGRVSSSYFTCSARRVTLVTNPMTSHD